jgi:hypothetical protein
MTYVREMVSMSKPEFLLRDEVTLLRTLSHMITLYDRDVDASLFCFTFIVQ